MKRWIRNLLIAGIVMSFVGIAMLIICFVTGGTGYLMGYDNKQVGNLGLYQFASDKQVIEGEIKSLDINVEVADLELRLSEDDKYYIEYNVSNSVNQNPLLISQKSGNLSITTAYDRPAINVDARGIMEEILRKIKGDYVSRFDGEDEIIVLYVPKDSETGMGLISGNISMQTGDFKCKNVDISKLYLDNQVGDVELINVKVSNELNVNTETGDIAVKLEDDSRKVAYISAYTETGDILVDLPSEHGEFSGSFKSKIGSDKEDAPKVSLHAETGDIEIK